MTSFHLRGTAAAGCDRVLDVIRANANLGSLLDTAVARHVHASIMIGAQVAGRGSILSDAPPLSPVLSGLGGDPPAPELTQEAYVLYIAGLAAAGHPIPTDCGPVTDGGSCCVAAALDHVDSLANLAVAGWPINVCARARLRPPKRESGPSAMDDVMITAGCARLR